MPASATECRCASDRVLGEDRVHLVPGRSVDDRLVLAGMLRPLVYGLAEVDAVVEDFVECALVDRLARRCLPSCVVHDFVTWPAQRSSCASWSPSRRAGTD